MKWNGSCTLRVRRCAPLENRSPGRHNRRRPQLEPSPTVVRDVISRYLILAALLSLAPVVACSTPVTPQRVLILHSVGPNFAEDLYSSYLKAELVRRSPGRVELYEQWLPSSHVLAAKQEQKLVDYLDSLFVDRRLDLVITLGAPAAQLVQSHRRQLFPQTPELFAGGDARTIGVATLDRDQTTVVRSIRISQLIEGIRRILPGTRTAVVVIGNSPIEHFWAARIREAFAPYAPSLQARILDGLSLEEQLERISALPRDSVILYVLLTQSLPGGPDDDDLTPQPTRPCSATPTSTWVAASSGAR